MKRAAIALSLAVLLPAPAFAEEAVQFDFTISRGDHVVGSPRIVGNFGQPMSIKVSNAYRIEALAHSPNPAGLSMTEMTIELLDGAEPRRVPMSFLTKTDETTRLSYAVPNSETRVDIVQKRAEVRTK